MTLLVIMIVLLVVLTLLGQWGGFVLGVWLAGIVGWIANIVTLFKAPALLAWGVVEILRVVGVFVGPLGAVLGYV